MVNLFRVQWPVIVGAERIIGDERDEGVEALVRRVVSFLKIQ